MNRSFGSAKHKELDSQLPNGSLVSSNSGFYNSAKFSNVLHHGGCVCTYMNYLLILNRLRSFYYQNQTLYCVFNASFTLSHDLCAANMCNKRKSHAGVVILPERRRFWKTMFSILFYLALVYLKKKRKKNSSQSGAHLKERHQWADSFTRTHDEWLVADPLSLVGCEHVSLKHVCYDTLQTPHCYRCSRMMSIIPPLLRICSSTSGFLGFIISPRSFSCISNDILTQPLTKHCLWLFA